jgi:hypothetical protein
MFLIIFSLLFVPVILGNYENSNIVPENIPNPLPWHKVVFDFIKEKFHKFIELVKNFLGIPENDHDEKIERNIPKVFLNIRNSKN